MPNFLSLLDMLPNGGGDGQAFESLTPEAMALFNEQTPDAPDVQYFSFGANYHPGLIDTFKWPHGVILEKEGPNDGLVSVQSSKCEIALVISPFDAAVANTDCRGKICSDVGERQSSGSCKCQVLECCLGVVSNFHLIGWMGKHREVCLGQFGELDRLSDARSWEADHHFLRLCRPKIDGKLDQLQASNILPRDR